jgi:hypothetical protein
MISNDILNTLVLGTLLAIVAGFGFYVTQNRQPAELEILEQQETAVRLRQAEVSELLVEQAQSRALAEDALRRWNARYKVLPEYLSSPAVVAYLNQLSMDGFQSFDVTLGGVARGNGFSTLSYDVRGSGFFEALYRFVWEVENGRGLYKIRDLNLREISHDEPNPATDVPRRQQLVQFSMTVEAYFGGAEGMSAPESLMTVPDHVLPSRETAGNPFYPLVLANLPPNTDNLVDVENDELISVVGDVAVFRSSIGPRPVRQGERVYLGRLSSVDANRARVIAELNKGGIRERLEIELATGERFRQAIGPSQIVPLTAPRQARPSLPQPGTPEYRRLYGNGVFPSSDTPDAITPVVDGDLEPSSRRNEVGVQQPDRGVAIRPFPSTRPAPADDK